MKVRTGFVSNSSSSSFIVAIKNGSEITPEKLLKAFKVGKDSIFYTCAKRMAELLSQGDNMTEKEILEDWGVDSIKELEEEYQYALTVGKGKVLIGSASNEDEAIEGLLCDLDLNYEDDEIYIYKNGGY